MELARSAHTVLEPEDDARGVFARFVTDVHQRWRRSQKHHVSVELVVANALSRVLEVDMSASKKGKANRKGEIPKALGLVDRRSKTVMIRNMAIIFMIDHLQDFPDDGVDPLFYLELREAAKATADGFAFAGLTGSDANEDLTANYAMKIYKKSRLR